MDSKEISKGLKMEKSEHHLSDPITRKLVMDHVKEDPKYYSKQATKDSEKDTESKKKSEPDEKKKEKDMDDAYEKWVSMKEPAIKPTSVDEPYFPCVSINTDKAPDFKVGDEIEVEFKAVVESIEQDKKGNRARIELKEAKF